MAYHFSLTDYQYNHQQLALIQNSLTFHHLRLLLAEPRITVRHLQDNHILIIILLPFRLVN